tara:strand:- start:1502 stop:2062 length:561 start_codon:yes stop_codon:yes gene_type:complete
VKIALTGHTRGIGNACKQLLEPEHEIIGFSRTNGYNINEPKVIYELAKDADVFINNAQFQDYQTKLFDLFWDDWKYKHKTIINIQSSSKYPETQARFGNYVKYKQELDANVKAKTLRMRAGVSTFNCRVTNLIVGWTDTDMIKFLKHVKKMPPSKVAETLKWVLDQPQDLQIFELAVWHQNTKPDK